MNALLAIKPEFADKILSGKKRYEFRRSCFNDPDEVDHIFLYSTSPVMQIVGVFTTDRIVEAEPNQLWELYNESAGINHERFMNYFSDINTGYAIHVDEAYEFDEPIDPEEVFDDFSPPMSYFYLGDTISEKLREYLPSPLRTPQDTNLSQFTSDST